jgi:hypothetical protein
MTMQELVQGSAPRGALQLKEAPEGGASPSRALGVLQRKQVGPGAEGGAKPHEIAQQGLSGGGGALPFGAQIQASFGQHDISNVQAHRGQEAQGASEALGASAYAMGENIAFGQSPDLHTAAHEAAHVVQQRQGVDVEGGVGSKGDAYEDHADEVAERVVKGESAAELLGQSPGKGGAKEAVQKEEKPGGTTAPAPTGGTDQALEDKLAAVASAYKYICLKQRDAVNDLFEDSKKVDPPPFWQTALLALGEVALSVALGGIGGVVAVAVAKHVKDKVAEATAKVIADAMKDGAKTAAKLLFSGAGKLIAPTTKDPRELFFRSQRDTLTDTAAQQEMDFISTQKAQVRVSADPHKVADGLLAAIKENYTTAYDLQRSTTLDNWCVYQAQQEMGVHKEGGKEHGTNLNDQLGDTSGAGTLGIVIRVKRPGDAPEILRAEIEGLNEGLRGVIEARPIGQLKMPVTVHGEVGEDIGWAEEWINHKSQPTIRIGRNEQGVVWVPNSSSGNRWLYWRANPQPQLWGPGGPPRERIQQDALKGARLLIEQDLAGLSVSGKLAG